MDHSKLYKICEKFRLCMEKSHSQMSIGFECFPFGSCGDTCLILGAYLHENDFGVFNYVNGERGVNNSWMSHAWLEKDGTIIDITGDQFGDNNTAVYVGTENVFYQSFDIESLYPYFSSLTEKYIRHDRLCKDYLLIASLMELT